MAKKKKKKSPIVRKGVKLYWSEKWQKYMSVPEECNVIDKIDNILNEGIEVFEKGDKVRELPNGPFGKKGFGKVVKATRNSWSVKFPGDKETYEYQSGELMLASTKWTVIRTWRVDASGYQEAIDKTKNWSHDEVIVKKGKFKIK